MISRYSLPEMTRIWEAENKFKIWLEIELLALEAWSKLGEVPPEVVRTIRGRAKFNKDRIDLLEKELKHDVIAFLTSVAEFVGPDARYLHKGMTSSDVLDTCFAVQLVQSSEILSKDIDRLMSILKLRAHEFKDTIQIGRTHGIHAEPITFGLKLASWYEEMKRNKNRLREAAEQVAVGKISGAVGTFALVPPQVEEYVCQKLKLKSDPISTQIISRDRHAHFFSTLSLIGTTLEKMATEIRHLQRTEVLEVEEFFSEGQKGSSAMPHKKNPVLSENLCGLARLLRGYALASMENVPLWHERDISHSSAERVIGPDATILLDFMLQRMSRIIETLVVHPQNMKANLEKMRGLFFSQRVLLALTGKGVAREEAYKMVQRNAMKVWEEGADFLETLKKDPQIIRHLSGKELEPLFNREDYFRHVDTIFSRVFNEEVKNAEKRKNL